MLINLKIIPNESTPTSNNHISVLWSHKLQHFNKLLYYVMVDTSSKYKKEQ